MRRCIEQCDAPELARLIFTTELEYYFTARDPLIVNMKQTIENWTGKFTETAACSDAVVRQPLETRQQPSNTRSARATSTVVGELSISEPASAPARVSRFLATRFRGASV